MRSGTPILFSHYFPALMDIDAFPRAAHALIAKSVPSPIVRGVTYRRDARRSITVFLVQIGETLMNPTFDVRQFSLEIQDLSA